MRFSLKDYREVHFSFDILALYLNRLLVQVGLGLVGVFGVIFLFEQYGGSIAKVGLVHVIIFLGQLLLTPISAKLLSSLGMKRLMMLGVPFAFLAILAFRLWELNPLLAVAGHIASLSLYKSLYWLPYHVDFAHFTDKRTRGRQMSVLLSVSQMLAVATPLVSGLVLAASGFNNLFLISLAVLFVSVLPLFLIRNHYEQYSYSYFQTFRELAKRKNRPLFLGYMSDGAQSGVTALAWPIFIFLLLEGEYLAVGAISAATILILIMLRLLTGNLLDRWDKKRVLMIGSILNTTGWLIKIFVETGFQIFLVDTYHGVGRMVNRLSIDFTTYDQAADNGSYIDEFTVLKEVSIAFGRAVAALLIIVIALAFSIKVAFFVAALASLLVTILNRQVALR